MATDPKTQDQPQVSGTEAAITNAHDVKADVPGQLAEASRNQARAEIEAEAARIVADARDEAERLVADARDKVEQIRVDSGLVPTVESESRKVGDGAVTLRYLGTSNRYYVGNDEDGKAVYADAGGEPVSVPQELADRITKLPYDRFEEVK